MIEAVVLLVTSGIQAYIIRRLDKIDDRLDRLEVELQIAIRKIPKRRDDS